MARRHSERTDLGGLSISVLLRRAWTATPIVRSLLNEESALELNRTPVDYEIANPDPAGTVASLSSFGYSLEAAIADLIDNCIAAEAKRIRVIFTWDSSASWIAVVDDGRGMNAGELVTAMTLAGRGPSTKRGPNDLGRFGMGLKTASFSQARTLTVHTRPAPATNHTSTWDLDLVTRTREWRLLSGTDEPTSAILDAVLPKTSTGTAVLWRQLRRYMQSSSDGRPHAQRQFYADGERVARHLGMVFARYLIGAAKVDIQVNGEPVTPWDPFLSGHPSVLRLPPEDLMVHGHLIRVEPFVLPHFRRLTEDERQRAGGPAGWLDQQGFYVYRRRRLILAGDWLGVRGLRRDERFNLARIAVHIPAEADEDWRIDVKKSSTVPPVGMRIHLERLANATRDRAAEVLNHRGRVAARAHSADFVYAWKVTRSNGVIHCTINREHPLVRRTIGTASQGSADVKALLRILEETVPIPTLRTMHQADTVDDPEPFAGAAPDEVVEVARRIYEALLGDNRTPAEAKRRIGQMPEFYAFSGFWNS